MTEPGTLELERNPETGTYGMAEPMAEPDPRRCTAHSARTGSPCKRYAIRGGTVCPTHGGSAPQVVEAARKRIREALLPIALDTAEDIMRSSDNDAARGAMARDIMDRSGLGTDDDAGTEGFRELLIRVREVRGRSPSA